MDMESPLLQALHDSPGDLDRRLVLADWLEEQGDPRAELLRLHLELLRAPWGQGDPETRQRLLALLDGGVKPCVPTAANSLGMTFALIPPGVFRMGSPEDEPDRFDDESPLHEVEITKPFYLGVHQVTQQQYEAVTGETPSRFRGDGAFPVENVSWTEADRFCRSLSALPEEKKAKRTYRLATEAEWEYACRAGASAQPYHFAYELLPSRANFEAGGLHRPQPVGSYPPNVWGLYDMHGNVWEWVSDWMAVDYYHQSPRRDPRGPDEDDSRGFRGGAWCSEPRLCRSACRSADSEDFRADYLGFRVVLEWKKRRAKRSLSSPG
jgi:uncharacterized protein (TIGR02996 family)